MIIALSRKAPFDNAAKLQGSRHNEIMPQLENEKIEISFITFTLWFLASRKWSGEKARNSYSDVTWCVRREGSSSPFLIHIQFLFNRQHCWWFYHSFSAVLQTCYGFWSWNEIFFLNLVQENGKADDITKKKWNWWKPNEVVRTTYFCFLPFEIKIDWRISKKKHKKLSTSRNPDQYQIRN